MKSSVLKIAALAASVFCASGALAQYTAGQQLVAVSLSGDTDTDAWSGSRLTAAANPGFGGFPGSGAWPSAIGSGVGGDAVLAKIANGAGGGPYPAGSSIYYGGFSGDLNTDGGTLAVQDFTPVAGLANVVFQIEIGEAWTHDFHNDALPVLSYTTASGTVENIAATQWALSSRFDNGTVSMPTGEETVYINAYLLQWDLSGVGESISSFAIRFTGVQHGQLYALQLDQSSAYGSVVSAVPEPASFAALAGLGVLGLAATRRRHRRQ